MKVWDGLAGALNASWFLLPGKQERKPTVTTSQKLARLASWPHLMPPDYPLLVQEILENSAAVFHVQRTLMAWEETDEPWLRVATTFDGQLRVSEESPTKYDPLVDESLWGLNFYCPNVNEAEPVVLWNSPTGLQQRRTHPLHEMLVEDYAVNSVLCLKLDGETIQGHLLILDLPAITAGDFVMGDLMTSLIASRTDQLMYKRAQRDAVNEERIRVARDLHDGLLQSFTGVVLQLETVHELLEKQPDEARRLVTQLQGVIMAEQRELRAYVDELRPRARRPSLQFDFRDRLADLRERFHNEWRINVDYEIGSMPPLVAAALGQETFRLISEAVMNSAKHGQASNVSVKLFTSDDRLRINISDNGIGFPFRGRYDLAALNAMHHAPASLSGRIASLNGDLVIESHDSGATLEISVPLGLQGT